MFIFNNFLQALASVLELVLRLYMWVVIGRAVISWVNPDPGNPAVQFLYRVTEPVLMRIRQWMPQLPGVDLSPFVLILAIMFLQTFLVNTLLELAGAGEMSRMPR